jgi:vacuolar protein sorting-associated protein 13A/C
LKSLVIEDLVCGGTSQCRYLARSFIGAPDVSIISEESRQSSNGEFSTEGDDKFYEAPENLPESDFVIPEVSSFKPPSFSRVPGLLPDSSIHSTAQKTGDVDEFGSFVKAQIIIYDQNSPFYSKIDNMVGFYFCSMQ